MKVILYKTKHGATKKIAKVLGEYLGDCFLMDYTDLDYRILEQAEMIIIGSPVYYGQLDSDIIRFIKENQELLVPRIYSLYVVGILQSEFMTFVNNALSYDILKDMKIIVGVGGALYYPKLSISEKMILQVMNKRSPIIVRQKGKDIFENFNNEEIEIFVRKIKKLYSRNCE